MKSPSPVTLLVVVGVIAVAIILVRGVTRAAIRGKGWAQAGSPDHPVVRVPTVAGAFYPAEAERLRSEVQQYLDQAELEPSAGELLGLIVPHAGYIYSGPVAAYAYRQLEGRQYETVVVVGPSHRVGFAGVALTGADEWATPLGRLPIDRAACEALMKADPDARVFENAHESEHSIEVQLPFLQATLREFKLVPILMADFSKENCAALARALADLGRERRVLLVASSDMSHYPAYEDAVRVDGETLKSIETLDADRVGATTKHLMSQRTLNLDTCLCGEGPVKAVLEAARLLGAERAEVLRYANSGDVPVGGRDRVVGYCAVAIYGKKTGSGESREQGELNRRQQERLLSVARSAIEEHVRTGRRLEVKESDPDLLRPGAAFVTLRKGGTLRGCIGILEASAPLIETVRDRAIMAATHDPRFPAVQPDELSQLEVEVSVLSPLRRVQSADEIDISKHGIVAQAGTRSGVFLPQVAEETGWSRDVLLAHLCRDKAGLSADAWKRDAALYVFTVQAFSSPAPGGG